MLGPVGDWLMQGDKFYAVVAVLFLIWVGIAAHLGWLTRKVQLLERQRSQSESSTKMPNSTSL
ncbi:MAG: hypothetical protein ACUVRD_08760 [Bacteroidia bacterium]